MTTSNRFCDQCGSQLKVTSRYCPSCGTSIDAGSDSTAAKLSNQPDNVSTVEERLKQTSSPLKEEIDWPCPSCGASNVRVAGQSRFAGNCSSCGASFASGGARLGRRGQPLPRGTEPPNYRLWIIFLAVFSLLFCFITLIAVFFAVCYSLQVRNQWERGDKKRAEKASNTAIIWVRTGGIIGGLLVWFSSWWSPSFVWIYVF